VVNVRSSERIGAPESPELRALGFRLFGGAYAVHGPPESGQFFTGER
jgi:hypothetical protein